MIFKKPILSLFFFALCVHVFYSIVFKLYVQIHLPNYQPPDSSTYLQAAKLLFEKFIPNPDRPMGIAFAYGIPYGLNPTPDIIGWGFFLNSFCWLCTCILVYKIVLQITASSKVALLSGMFFLVSIGTFFITPQILSESVFYCLFTLSFYFIVRFITCNNSLYIFYSLLSISVASIVRPGAYYLYMLCAIVSILFFIKNKTYKYIILVLLSYMPIFFQSYKMKKEYGVYTISFIDKGALINYWFARANYFKNGTTFEQENEKYRLKMKNIITTELSNFTTQEFKHQLGNNSSYLLKAYFYSLYENSKGQSSSLNDIRDETLTKPQIFLKRVLLYLSRVQNLCFVALGLFVFPFVLYKFRKKISRPVLYASAIGNAFVCYIIFTSAISYWQHDRFHLVFYPIVICILAFLHVEYWGKKMLNQ